MVADAMQALSTIKPQKRIIGELFNPTLRIAQGASVTLEIINNDDGAPHGVEITSAVQPYAYMTMR